MKEELKDKIIKAIDTGEVKMRPKWHFVVKGIAFGLGVMMAGLAALYVMSFIIFAKHRHGLMLPWFFIALAIALVFIVEALLRRYEFGFKRSLLVLGLAVVAFFAVTSFLVEESGFHERFSTPVYERYFRSGERVIILDPRVVPRIKLPQPRL